MNWTRYKETVLKEVWDSAEMDELCEAFETDEQTIRRKADMLGLTGGICAIKTLETKVIRDFWGNIIQSIQI